MKRLLITALALVFVLGAFGQAQAIEFRAKGDWQLGINAVKNPTFDSDDEVDEFMGTTRVRTTFEFIANENLRGVMRINSDDRTWGGDGLGREQGSFEYDRAYLDYFIPGTNIHMQVGKQGLTIPNTLGSHIFDDNIWAVNSFTPLNENVGLVLSWARANDMFEAGPNKNDEIDAFLTILPINMDGLQLQPFGIYGMKGQGAFANADVFPYVAGERRTSSHVYWGGINFTADLLDPLVLSGDFNYGRHSSNITGDTVGEETRGWIAALAAEYHTDHFTPELFLMYESGHSSSFTGKDGNTRGRVMPFISGDLHRVSSFGMSGSQLRGIGRAALDGYAGINSFGPSGKMAIGAGVRDLSLLDNVTHDMQLTYYQGTNHRDLRALGTEMDEIYFTTRDMAWEFTLDTQYQMYENLAAILELGYLAPSLSSGGDRDPDIQDDDAWKAATGLRFQF